MLPRKVKESKKGGILTLSTLFFGRPDMMKRSVGISIRKNSLRE